MTENKTNSSSLPTTVEKILFLKENDIFSEVPPDSLLNVVSVAHEVAISNGVNVFKEGELSIYLFLVVSGQIKISRQQKEIFVAKSKESFGLVGLVEEKRRETTATAIEDSVLLRIGLADLFDLMEDFPAITRGVLRGVSKVLRKLL